MNYAVHNSQVADRLPFTGETLVSSKIGKIVRKLAKDAPIPGEYSLLFRRSSRAVPKRSWVLCGLQFMHQP
jgi:hypothetical protein